MKILENPEQSSYFEETKYSTVVQEIENAYKHFDVLDKSKFIQELSQYSDINKQAGYSSSKQCEYLALVLVLTVYSNDGSCSHDVKSTYLTHKDNLVIDTNGNPDEENDDLHVSVRTVYHPLPDGKLIEVEIKENYFNELDDIYKEVINIRNSQQKKKKIKP